MLSYCLKCRQNMQSKNAKVATIKNRKIMLLSKCAKCDSKTRNLSKSKKLVNY